MKQDIQALKEQNGGTLPAYAFPGGYPLFYVDQDNDTLCPTCANNVTELDPSIVSYEINWEDPTLYCIVCGEEIECAYCEED